MSDNLMDRGHQDFGKTRHGHVWGSNVLKSGLQFFVKLGLCFFNLQ